MEQDHDDLKDPRDKVYNPDGTRKIKMSYWPNGQPKDPNDMWSGGNNFGGTARNSLGQLYEEPVGNPIRGPQAPGPEPKTTIKIDGPMTTEESLEVKVEELKKSLLSMELIRANIMKAFNNKIPITLASQMESYYHSLYYQWVLESSDLQLMKGK